MQNFKLDYKKTIYVGLAFFIITIFWQTYDTIIARILIDKFGLSQTLSGVVMALDNIFALILLPVFGALSDKSNHKRGRRTPFIIIGTIIGAVAFMGLSYTDYLQSEKLKESNTNISEVYEYAFSGDTYEHWSEVINSMDLERKTTLGESSKEYIEYKVNIFDELNSSVENKTGKVSVRDNKDIKDNYYRYLSSLSSEVTKENPHVLIIFLGTLLIALLAMSFFRSPAVALMPDVTIKPLRSKANAIINLMGSLSAMVALGFLMFTGKDKTSYVLYYDVFIFIGVMMLLVLGVFLWKVKEPQLVLEKQKEDELHGLTEIEEEQDENAPRVKLEKPVFISLMLILSSVFLWFMGYNAVISKVSDYAPKVLNMGSALPTMVAHGVAIIAFLPLGRVSSKIGRKKSILIGIIILASAFLGASFITESSGFAMYIVFGLVGIGWATINVNSFPMVVELAKGSDVGRYTGYYYFFSMAAQIATPIISGFLMDTFSRYILFPYAAIFVAASFVTMFFVKHGDSKPEAKKGLEAFDVED